MADRYVYSTALSVSSTPDNVILLIRFATNTECCRLAMECNLMSVQAGVYSSVLNVLRGDIVKYVV